KDTLHALEGVLTRFPKDGKIVGVLYLIVSTFSEGVADEIKSSVFKIILANTVNMNTKLIDYASTIPSLNFGEEEVKKKIKNLELRVDEFRRTSTDRNQDLKNSNRGLRFL
ncbi:10793_t:CDS:1, partial [Paraglomus occultum]